MQRNKIVKFPISHGIHQVICVKLAKRGPLLVVLVSRVFQCHLVVIPKVTVYHHTPWLLPVAGNDFLNRHGISPLLFFLVIDVIAYTCWFDCFTLDKSK